DVLVARAVDPWFDVELPIERDLDGIADATASTNREHRPPGARRLVMRVNLERDDGVLGRGMQFRADVRSEHDRAIDPPVVHRQDDWQAAHRDTDPPEMMRAQQLDAL